MNKALLMFPDGTWAYGAGKGIPASYSHRAILIIIVPEDDKLPPFIVKDQRMLETPRQDELPRCKGVALGEQE